MTTSASATPACASDDLGGTLVPIVTFRYEADNKPVAAALTLAELMARLSRHSVRAAKDGPAWSPVTYKAGTTRAKANVDQVHALVLDVDHVELPYDRLAGLTWVAHTTHSHNPPEDPRRRVVIPLTRPIAANDWPVYWRRARERFGEAMDEACKDSSRLYFWPACRPGAPHQTEIGEGDLLDPDSLPEVRASESMRPAAPRRAWSGDLKPYARKALEDEVSKVATAPPGTGRGTGRNLQLNKSAFALGQLVGGGELPRGLVEQELLTAAERCGLVNDDGMRSAEKTLASGLDAGELHARTAPPSSPPLSAPPHRLQVLKPMDRATETNGSAPQHPMPPANGKTTEQKEPSQFHLSDLGNAQRLVAIHGEDLRYCFQVNRWYIWDRRRWAEDTTAEVERRAKATVRSMYRDAADYPEDDKVKREQLVKHALKSEGHRQLTAMVALARSEPGVPVTTDQLDHDRWLLVVKNGTIDLRTGKLCPHRREDLITKLVPIEYDASATCPTWTTFLERVLGGNRSLIEFLQRAVGYSLTGSTREQVAFFLHGLGANGKSTLLETISALLGDYARTTRAETLLVKTYDGGIPNDIAALKGARFVSTSETEDGKRLAEALLKGITGGDPLTARFMRGEYFEFKPDFKLWLATNHKPTIRGTDHAIWRRIRLVPFEVQIPDAEQDKDLPQKLQRELAGILTWAVRGCLDWQRSGLGTPEAVIAATQNYRDEMDVLAAFLSDCCVSAGGASERAQRLWERWQSWCQDTGERPGTQKGFGLRLKEKGFQQSRTRDREQARIWLGLGLVGQEQQSTLNADASGMQTHPDANPGINGLYTPHGALPREMRLHASVRENASAAAGQSDKDDIVEVEL